jgi:branched-chain amino acid transport system substrate-binding protein
MIKSIRIGIVGFIGLCLILSMSAVALAAENVFKFAHLGPFSGPAAGWGLHVKRGLVYAIDDFNKKGGLLVGGKRYQIEYVGYDNKYQTQETVSALNKAIFGDKVQYVTVQGQHCAVVAVPICEANKILHLANASGGAEITNAKNFYTFRTLVAPNSLGSILYYPEVMKDFGVKKIALVNPDDEGGYSTSNAIKNVVKQLSPAPDLVADEYYVRGTPDFTPIILRVLAKKPDLIDLGISGPGDAGLFLKQAGEAGYTGLTMNSASLVLPEVLWQTAGKSAKGHFVIAFAESPTPEYEALEKRYVAEFGPPASIIAPFSYDTVKALFMAIEKANTFDTRTVTETLGNMKWNGVYGPSRWMGKEKILGFGINRSYCVPTPMSRVIEGGRLEKWKSKSLPLEQ